MKLGVLYKNNEIVNHRSLLKVILNPIFRYFGVCLGTNYNNGQLGWYSFMKCQRQETIKWDMNNHNDFDHLEKKRWLI